MVSAGSAVRPHGLALAPAGVRPIRRQRPVLAPSRGDDRALIL